MSMPPVMIKMVAERLRAENAGGQEAALNTLSMIEELSEDEVKKMLAELEGKAEQRVRDG